jgi:hypothetical protein
MKTRLRIWLVVLCACVMLLVTSAEAFHVHHGGGTSLSKKSENSCLICSSLHAPALSIAVVILGGFIATLFLAARVLAERRTRLEAFGLFVRPPPRIA